MIPRSSCHPDKAYIITGGLGGFGLELSEWLIERGAQCLILTSRSGVKSGYQKRKLQKWQKKGVQVIISKRDLQSEQDTADLIEETSQLKQVGGIFHLAMVRIIIYIFYLFKKKSFNDTNIYFYILI